MNNYHAKTSVKKSTKNNIRRIDINRIQLGENLRKIRLERKMSQEQFAEVIGISKSFLEKIESGEKLMSLITFCDAVGKLNITADSLLNINYECEKVAEESFYEK